MKLAILSDIHSNLEALEAAFEDLQNQSVDTIYCIGDLVGQKQTGSYLSI